MSRRWLLSLLCLSAAVVFVQLSSARSGLSVNEPATKFLVQDQAVVVLEVVNPSSQNLPVHLKLPLLDPKDLPRGQSKWKKDRQECLSYAYNPDARVVVAPATLSSSERGGAAEELVSELTRGRAV